MHSNGNSNNGNINISNFEFEDIKYLMPLTVSELNIYDQFSQYLTNLNSTLYLMRDDIENSNDNVEYNNIVRIYNKVLEKINSQTEGNKEYYIERYPSYYKDNQLEDELFLFSKYSDGFIGVDKNGNVTMNTSDFIDYVENTYQFPQVSSFDIENNSPINGIYNYELLNDFSNIVQSKYLSNFYGEYYSDDMYYYIDIANKAGRMNNYSIDLFDTDIETSEFTTYKNTGRKFQFVTDTIDDKFMIYNIKYILNQGSSVLSKEYNNVLSKIKKCTNNIEIIKLYFINNKLAIQINQNLNKFKFKSRFEMVEKMENYINTLSVLLKILSI